MGSKKSEQPKTWKVRSRFHRAKKAKTARSSKAKTKGKKAEGKPPTRSKSISPHISEDDIWPKDFCRQQEGELRWKMFTDEEYANWKAFKDNDCKVPLRSVFSYLKVRPYPVTIGNVPRKTSVPDVLADMVKGNRGAYTRIKIGDQLFQCIPNLLKCYSVWFANRDWRMTRFEFCEQEVPARGFVALYDWMRTEQLPEFQVAVATLQAARHLRVPLLEKDCWQVLSTDEVREKRAFLVFQEAKELPALGEVCEAMLGRLRNFFLALVGSPEFLDLEIQVLEILLRERGLPGLAPRPGIAAGGRGDPYDAIREESRVLAPALARSGAFRRSCPDRGRPQSAAIPQRRPGALRKGGGPGKDEHDPSKQVRSAH